MGITVTIVSQIELGSNEADKHGVIGGIGIGIGVSVLSLYTVSFELRPGMLTILDVKGFPRIRQWHIDCHSGKLESFYPKSSYCYLHM